MKGEANEEPRMDQIVFNTNYNDKDVTQTNDVRAKIHYKLCTLVPVGSQIRVVNVSGTERGKLSKGWGIPVGDKCWTKKRC